MKEELARKIVEEFLRPLEIIGDSIRASFRVHVFYESLDGKEIGQRDLNFIDGSNWTTAGWLLERLPEWEELEDFMRWADIPTYCQGKKLAEGCFIVNSIDAPRIHLLPLDWLTSPSVLPEKVGEYIKWKDEKK